MAMSWGQPGTIQCKGVQSGRPGAGGADPAFTLTFYEVLGKSLSLPHLSFPSCAMGLDIALHLPVSAGTGA